jgi:hypothetical protein
MIDPQRQPKSVLQSMMDALSRNDHVFEHFARTVNGRLGVNHHNRPSRAITVAGADAVVRQIEVSAVSPPVLSLTMIPKPVPFAPPHEPPDSLPSRDFKGAVPRKHNHR